MSTLAAPHRRAGRLATEELETPGRGEALVRWTRARLREELGGPKAIPPEGAWCEELAATFVTLRWRDGRLQGCVGRLEATRPLVVDVAHNAIAAALDDPRAAPVEQASVDDLDVEISILSPLETIDAHEEESALAALRPGTDGVVLEWRGRRATFLPSMWPVLGEARVLLRELKRKAGLAPDFWAPDARVLRYTVVKYTERAPSLVPKA